MVAGNTNVWEWVWCDKGSSANETHWQEYRNGYQQYLLRAIMIPKWLFLPAVFRPLRTAFRGLGADFLNLGEKTEGTAKKRGKNEQKWARNGLRRVGVSGNHYCPE